MPTSYWFPKKKKIKGAALEAALDDIERRKEIICKLELGKFQEILKDYNISDTTLYQTLKMKNIIWDKSKSHHMRRKLYAKKDIQSN